MFVINEHCWIHLGADLANMVNAAAIYAASEGDTNVTTKHLEFAKDKILMGECLIKLFIIIIFLLAHHTVFSVHKAQGNMVLRPFPVGM